MIIRRFQGSVNATWLFHIRNLTNGTAARARFQLQGDGADVTRLEHISTGFTSSGAEMANAGRLYCSSGVGFNIEVNQLRIYQNLGVILNPGVNHGSGLFSTGGASSGFNGLGLMSNVSECASGTGGTRGAQANTGLPSWMCDIGGTFGEAPFGTDTWGVYRRPAAGNWALICQISSTIATFAVDVVPDSTANTRDFGGSSQKWDNIWAVTVNTGDIALENEFRVTEHDKVGIATPGVAIVNKDGELCMFVEANGRVHAKSFVMHDDDWRSLRGL